MDEILECQGFEFSTDTGVWEFSITGSTVETVAVIGDMWRHWVSASKTATIGEGSYSLEAHLVATAP